VNHSLKELVRESIRVCEVKGTWTGLGTDAPIFHRHEPKKRGSSSRSAVARREAERKATAKLKWDAADERQRRVLLNQEFDGYDRDVRDRFQKMSFDELTDGLMPDDISVLVRATEQWL